MMLRRLLPSAVLLVLLVAGCSDNGTDPVPPDDGPADTGDPGDDGDDGDNGDPPGATVFYATDVQRIWDDNCIGCHGVGGNGELNLTAPGSRTNLVGADAFAYSGQRVVDGQPDQSVLYLKLTGDASVGGQMPPGGSLGAADLEKVRVWIAEGALDN